VKLLNLKLRKPSAQKASLPNDGVDHNAPELEVPHEDNGKKTDLIELTGSSSS
jgi:hypothetical protein